MHPTDGFLESASPPVPPPGAEVIDADQTGLPQLVLKATVSVRSAGAAHRGTKPGWLISNTCISHSSGDWKAENQVPAKSGSAERPFLVTTAGRERADP